MNRLEEFISWIKDQTEPISWHVTGMQLQTGLPFATHNLEIVFPEFDDQPLLEILADPERLESMLPDRVGIYLKAEDRLEFGRRFDNMPSKPVWLIEDDCDPVEIEWSETVEAFLNYQPYTVPYVEGWSLKSVLEGIEIWLTMKLQFSHWPRLAYTPIDMIQELTEIQLEQDAFLAEVKEWFANLPTNSIISWYSPSLTPEAPYAHQFVEIGIDGIDDFDWTWLLTTEPEMPADKLDPFMLFAEPDADVFYTLKEGNYDLINVLMQLPSQEKFLLPPLSMPPFSHPHCYQTKRNEKIAVYRAPAWSPRAVTSSLQDWLRLVVNRPDIQVVWAWRAPQSIEHQELLLNLGYDGQLRDHFINGGTWVTQACANWYHGLDSSRQKETWANLEEYLDALSNIKKVII